MGVRDSAVLPALNSTKMEFATLGPAKLRTESPLRYRATLLFLGQKRVEAAGYARR